MSTRPPLGWWIASVLASVIVVYALAYVVVGPAMYPPNLAASLRARPWGIYPHAFFGAVALALGPAQFHRGILGRRRGVHRALGTIYLASCMLIGTAGLYMAIYSFGGWVTHLGFAGLAVALLATTRCSYALVFAAVTLRMELSLLTIGFGAFLPAYQVVAGLCWVPNALWAEWYVRPTARAPLPTIAELRPA